MMPSSPAMGGGMGGGGPGGYGGGPGSYAAPGDAPQGAAGMGAPMMGGGGQAVAGIAKNMSWKFLFFGAACCTLASSIIAIIYMIITIKIAPCSFTTVLFMLFFGLMQVVLDFPVPHPNQTLAWTRLNIYKFLLFLTRFTGRGIWYLFLGTMIFATLWDLKISYFFGICLGGYVGILGLVTLVFGVRLSQRLDQVRKALLHDDKPPPHGGYSTEGFRTLAQQVSSGKIEFTDDELTYVFNSLSFTASNDGVITPEEYKQWLLPGKMEMV